MICGPKIIFADEPTGALDSHSARVLLEIIAGLQEELEATIFMVTHDAFCASYAERILFLKDGRIFTEILKGEKTRSLFYNEILDVLPLMVIATSVLIILVLGWLVSYMTGYMLKKRSRELSIYMVSGLSNRTIAGLFLYEKMIIAGASFAAGLPAGALLARLIEASVLRMFGMGLPLVFPFPSGRRA